MTAPLVSIYLALATLAEPVLTEDFPALKRWNIFLIATVGMSHSTT